MDYDSIPYESVPFSESHPQRLAMLGRLFGIHTTLPERCRVLELGCASGGNLIPMAWRLPQSEFVGIDLSAEQVRIGQQTIDRLGISNIRLQQQDLCQFDDLPGSFDYIIAHGLYSWVPASVRDALLALIQRLLSPTGVAYVSYNTQPGWASRGILRSMAFYHAREITDPPARLQSMLELFDFLRGYYQTSKNPLQQQLYAELKAIETSHPSYLYHDFLEVNNDPVLFSEFVTHIETHSLKYLCESELHTMFASTLPDKGQRFLDRYDDMLVQEQYIDYLQLRTFRMSLLVHQQCEPRYDIDLEILDGFSIHSHLLPPANLQPNSNKAVSFNKPDRGAVAVNLAATKSILQLSYAASPAALPLGALYENAIQPLPDKVRASCTLEDVRSELFNLFVNGCIEFVLSPYTTTVTSNVRPKLTKLAAAEAAAGNTLSGAWHEPVHLDDFSRLLLEQLDGEQDIPALTANILARVRSDDTLARTLKLDPKLAAKRQEANILANIQRLLDLFRRHGILQ